MPKPHLPSPIQRICERVRQFFEKLGGDIQTVYCEPHRTGLLIVVKCLDRTERFLLTPFNGNGADDEAPFATFNLTPYMFDRKADAPPDLSIFAGLISRGDHVTWLGREKHRKSNFLLQFAVCAAIGGDFLGFKYVPLNPSKVMYLDFESKGRSLKERLDGIIRAVGLSDVERHLVDTNLQILEIRRIRKAGHVFPKFPHRTARGRDAKNNHLRFWEELVVRNPADIFIIDPMRSLHSADENDSSIEALLAEMQRIFKNSAIVVAHHMRKSGDNTLTLVQDMRAWSEGGRGSGAINAHSDVIVNQERTTDEKGNEVVWLGAFLKDGADIEPFPLMESDHKSFFWIRTAQVPEKLRAAYESLLKMGAFTRAKAADQIKRATQVSRATAYRHFDALSQAGLLSEKSGRFRVRQRKEGGFETKAISASESSV